VFGEELEVIPTYFECNPPENCQQAVWYLGESIKKMSEADYFIGIGYSDVFHGCNVESEVARRYNIRRTHVEICDLMQDEVEVEKEYWNSCARMPF
jgi:hypothetical protein